MVVNATVLGGEYMSDEKMVTSIKVDRELWKEAKIRAIKNGMALYELLDKALRKELGVEKDE